MKAWLKIHLSSAGGWTRERERETRKKFELVVEVSGKSHRKASVNQEKRALFSVRP